MISDPIDIVVVCATPSEFSAVQNALQDVTLNGCEQYVGSNKYDIRTVGAGPNRGVLRLLLMSVGEIGRLPAGIAARDLLFSLQVRPAYVILCGIAAADPDSGYQLGDVVVPRTVIDYAEQKRSPDDLKIRSRSFETNRQLHRVCGQVAASDWFTQVPALTVDYARGTAKFRTPAECHLDIQMACGDYVLDDEAVVKDLLSRLSKDKKYPVTCVEMESTAVARALEGPFAEPWPFLVIKAISDFAYNKTDSAQPYARATAAFFLKNVLLKLADTKPKEKPLVQAPAPIVTLGPSPSLLAMLDEFPPEIGTSWRHHAVDGMVEVIRCSSGAFPYGGITNDRVLCDVGTNHDEWPEDFGGLSEAQVKALSAGLIGDNTTRLPGWLRGKRGSPGRIRVFAASPFAPSVEDREHLSLSFANSDYFASKTIFELSCRQRDGSNIKLKDIFPERWAPGTTRFTTACVPYHVSIHAAITCEVANCQFLILTRINPNNPTLADGWQASMAEQMWAPDRVRAGAPWWREPTRVHGVPVAEPHARIGDFSLEETLRRGMRDEFSVNIDGDVVVEPRLLLGAIEEDSYFFTFVYALRLRMTPRQLYEKWMNAPGRDENILMAAYQLTGMTRQGSALEGANQIAALLGRNQFDAGPHLLPDPKPANAFSGHWDPTARLSIYALGMHLWPYQVPQLVRLE